MAEIAPGVKLLMLGKSGIGKTTQLKDLDPATTLFLDIEAGDLAVADWPATPSVRLRGREPRLLRVPRGPGQVAAARAPSQAHYDHVIEKFGDPTQLDRYQTSFSDSITQLSRQCFAWCKTPAGCRQRPLRQTRPARGLWPARPGNDQRLTHLQHARGKNVVFVAILDERLDDYNRKVFVPQIEGSKTSWSCPASSTRS